MSNNSNMDRLPRLGANHPHKNLQHAAYDKVHEKDYEGWMKEWLSWLLEISYDDSPLVNREGNPFDKNYESLYRVNQGSDEGVMFLAAPAYGSGGSTYSNNFEIVPLGNWDIFFVPYMIYNSTLEYPSLSEEELFSMATRQVDAVYRLEVLMDGLSVECCRVQIPPARKVTLPIHDKNVLGISQSELKSANESITIVGDGYACFLKPLSPGLHILSYKAYSPSYSLETQIQLNVRGPKTKINS
jgi:hypothetical protein